MPVYCVVLSPSNPQGLDAFEKKLRALFPDMFPLSNNAYVLSSHKSNTQVAIDLGLQPHEVTPEWSSEFSGVVFSLNGSYSGFHQPGLWSWLARHGAA